MRSYKYWQEIVRRFPKDMRYTLGAQISGTYIELLKLIFLASITSGAPKLSLLQNAIITLDLLKFFMQVAWESKTLDTAKYTALSDQLNQIGKQLGGWYRERAGHLAKTNPARL